MRITSALLEPSSELGSSALLPEIPVSKSPECVVSTDWVEFRNLILCPQYPWLPLILSSCMLRLRNPRAKDRRMAELKSYHCICSNFVLITPFDVSRLPCRADPGLDRALILPMSAPAQGSEDVAPREADQALNEQLRDLGFEHLTYGDSIFESTLVDRKPIMIRRGDGFEKRWGRRCSHCRTTIGYALRSEGNEGPGDRSDAKKVAYLLDDALMETEQLQRDMHISQANG